MKLLLLLLLLLPACSPVKVEDEHIVVGIDKSMLPVRIIPEGNLECVIIDRDGKSYTEEKWFRLVR